MGQRFSRPESRWLRVPDFAWPTLVLFCAVLLSWGVGVFGGAVGWIRPALAVALVTAADYAAFTVMHEASHGLLGRGRRGLNQAVGEVCAALLFCRFNGFRQVHLRHHREACEPDRDPDAWAGEGPWWQLPLRWATADLHYWLVYDRSVPPPRGARTASRCSLLLCVGALGVAVAGGFGRELLLFVVLPARLALFVSTYFFDYLPHQRPHGRSSRVAPHQSAVVLKGGPLLDALLLGHSLHLVHHLHPSVVWYRLRRVYRGQRDELLAAGAREVWPFSAPRPFEGGAADTTRALG